MAQRRVSLRSHSIAVAHTDQGQIVGIDQGRKSLDTRAVGKDATRTAVFQRIVQFFGCPPRIQQHRYRTDRCDRHQGNCELRTVAAGNCHRIAFADPQIVLKSMGQFPDIPTEFFICPPFVTIYQILCNSAALGIVGRLQQRTQVRRDIAKDACFDTMNRFSAHFEGRISHRHKGDCLIKRHGRHQHEPSCLPSARGSANIFGCPPITTGAVVRKA